MSKAPVNWEKVNAVATAGTLLVSILIGGLGVFLGYKALTLATEMESLKIRPILVEEHGYRQIKIVNAGFGPAGIKSFSARFRNRDGEYVWLRYSDSANGYNMWDYLEIRGVNDGLSYGQSTLVNFPWIGAVYGPNEVFNVLRTPDYDSLPTEWQDKYLDRVKYVYSNLRVCITYESLDEKISKRETNPTCQGPRDGDKIYLGTYDDVPTYTYYSSN